MSEKTRFAVHLFTNVRVQVVGIEAATVADAVKRAEAMVDLQKLLENPKPGQPNVGYVEWDEGPTNFVLVDHVDAVGDVVEGSFSHYLDGDGTPMIDNKTTVERKAEAADAAILFLQELQNSVESIGGIVEQHGAHTLADLMYLQAAILTGQVVDSWPESSAVLKVVSDLPSGAKWTAFIRNQPMVADGPL